jgi:hypothetical protein
MATSAMSLLLFGGGSSLTYSEENVQTAEWLAHAPTALAVVRRWRTFCLETLT